MNFVRADRYNNSSVFSTTESGAIIGRMVRPVSSCSSSTISMSSNVAKATSSVSSLQFHRHHQVVAAELLGQQAGKLRVGLGGSHVEQRQHQIVGVDLGDVLVLDQTRS